MARWLVPQRPLPSSASRLFYGIDLGTTYTLVAYVDSSKISGSFEQLPVAFQRFEQRSPLPMDVPEEDIFVASALALDERNRPFVGNRVYQLKGSPGFQRYRNLFYHFKLDLGTSAHATWYQQAQHEDYNHPAKLSGKLLNFCRKMTLRSDQEWRHVVITVPASFQHAQRADVLEAAKYARIVHDRNLLADEPNAALVGYLNECPVEIRMELIRRRTPTTWLVIDFGGGTCDLSVLEVEYRDGEGLLVRNAAISRYQDVGGQDLDRLLVEMFLLEGVRLPQDEHMRHLTVEKLCALAEKIKIRLARTLASAGSMDEWSVLLPRMQHHEEILLDAELPQGARVDLRITAAQLREATHRLFEHGRIELNTIEKVLTTIPAMVSDILEKANKTKSQISHVLLVGGSVQNPWFVEETKKLFAQSRVILPPTPDLLVAKGAAVISFFRHGLQRELIRPVLSDTVGVITREGFFPLAECGIPLPVRTKVGGFRPQSSFQHAITVPVCLGDESFVVGSLRIPLELPYQPGSPDIALEVEVNEEKIIEVRMLWNGVSKGRIKVEAPTQPVTMTREQRLEYAYQQAVGSRSVAEQKRLLKKLMSEYFDQHNWQRLADTAEKYLNEYDSTDPHVLNYAYLGYRGLGYNKKAGRYLKEAVERAPDESYLHYNYSLWLGEEEGPAAALKHLEQLQPPLRDRPSLRMRRALLLHALGRNVEARTLMRQLIDEFRQGRWRIHSAADAAQMRRIAKIMGENLIVEDPERYDDDDSAGFISEDTLLHAPRALRRKPGEED